MPGLIDLDIHGPNIPKMLGIEGARLQSYDGKVIEPVRVTGNLAVVSMAFLLPERNTPVIWRGPMKMAAIRQFLEDVNWGDLDYLVVDLPPGTGDEALTIAQLAPNIAGLSSSPPLRKWQFSTRAKRSSLLRNSNSRCSGSWRT